MVALSLLEDLPVVSNEKFYALQLLYLKQHLVLMRHVIFDYDEPAAFCDRGDDALAQLNCQNTKLDEFEDDTNLA